MLSSVAGLPGRGGVGALKAAGAIPVSAGSGEGAACSVHDMRSMHIMRSMHDMRSMHEGQGDPHTVLLCTDDHTHPEAPGSPHLSQELMLLLKESPFHVRKEAAFALANICADGGGGTGAPACLPVAACGWLRTAALTLRRGGVCAPAPPLHIIRRQCTGMLACLATVLPAPGPLVCRQPRDPQLPVCCRPRRPAGHGQPDALR